MRRTEGDNTAPKPAKPAKVDGSRRAVADFLRTLDVALYQLCGTQTQMAMVVGLVAEVRELRDRASVASYCPRCDAPLSTDQLERGPR